MSTVHFWQHAEKRWFPNAKITTDEATSQFQCYFSTECNLVSSGHPMGKVPPSAVYLGA